MPVFRIEKTKDYTVMSNHHLKDKELTLKAKGLLSLMLSLPENWDYTTKGLTYICKEGLQIAYPPTEEDYKKNCDVENDWLMKNYF